MPSDLAVHATSRTGTPLRHACTTPEHVLSGNRNFFPFAFVFPLFSAGVIYKFYIPASPEKAPGDKGPRGRKGQSEGNAAKRRKRFERENASRQMFFNFFPGRESLPWKCSKAKFQLVRTELLPFFARTFPLQILNFSLRGAKTRGPRLIV